MWSESDWNEFEEYAGLDKNRRRRYRSLFASAQKLSAHENHDDGFFELELEHSTLLQFAQIKDHAILCRTKVGELYLTNSNNATYVQHNDDVPLY